MPSNIGKLTDLRDLNLMKNGLIQLPPSLCDLTGLTRLELSSNKLRRLPDRFGSLQQLSGTLSIEMNRLEKLPDSVGFLKVSILRLSNNCLEALPRSL